MAFSRYILAALVTVAAAVSGNIIYTIMFALLVAALAFNWRLHGAVVGLIFALAFLQMVFGITTILLVRDGIITESMVKWFSLAGIPFPDYSKNGIDYPACIAATVASGLVMLFSLIFGVITKGLRADPKEQLRKDRRKALRARRLKRETERHQQQRQLMKRTGSKVMNATLASAAATGAGSSAASPAAAAAATGASSASLAVERSGSAKKEQKHQQKQKQKQQHPHHQQHHHDGDDDDDDDDDDTTGIDDPFKMLVIVLNAFGCFVASFAAPSLLINATYFIFAIVQSLQLSFLVSDKAFAIMNIIVASFGTLVMLAMCLFQNPTINTYMAPPNFLGVPQWLAANDVALLKNWAQAFAIIGATLMASKVISISVGNEGASGKKKHSRESDSPEPRPRKKEEDGGDGGRSEPLLGSSSRLWKGDSESPIAKNPAADAAAAAVVSAHVHDDHGHDGHDEHHLSVDIHDHGGSSSAFTEDEDDDDEDELVEQNFLARCASLLGRFLRKTFLLFKYLLFVLPVAPYCAACSTVVLLPSFVSILAIPVNISALLCSPRTVVATMSTLLIVYTIAFMIQVACGSMANRAATSTTNEPNPIPSFLMKFLLSSYDDSPADMQIEMLVNGVNFMLLCLSLRERALSVRSIVLASPQPHVQHDEAVEILGLRRSEAIKGFVAAIYAGQEEDKQKGAAAPAAAAAAAAAAAQSEEQKAATAYLLGQCASFANEPFGALLMWARVVVANYNYFISLIAGFIAGTAVDHLDLLHAGLVITTLMFAAMPETWIKRTWLIFVFYVAALVATLLLVNFMSRYDLYAGSDHAGVASHNISTGIKYSTIGVDPHPPRGSMVAGLIALFITSAQVFVDNNEGLRPNEIIVAETFMLYEWSRFANHYIVRAWRSRFTLLIAGVVFVGVPVLTSRSLMALVFLLVFFFISMLTAYNVSKLVHLFTWRATVFYSFCAVAAIMAYQFESVSSPTQQRFNESFPACENYTNPSCLDQVGLEEGKQLVLATVLPWVIALLAAAAHVDEIVGQRELELKEAETRRAEQAQEAAGGNIVVETMDAPVLRGGKKGQQQKQQQQQQSRTDSNGTDAQSLNTITSSSSPAGVKQQQQQQHKGKNVQRRGSSSGENSNSNNNNNNEERRNSTMLNIETSHVILDSSDSDDEEEEEEEEEQDGEDEQQQQQQQQEEEQEPGEGSLRRDQRRIRRKKSEASNKQKKTKGIFSPTATGGAKLQRSRDMALEAFPYKDQTALFALTWLLDVADRAVQICGCIYKEYSRSLALLSFVLVMAEDTTLLGLMFGVFMLFGLVGKIPMVYCILRAVAVYLYQFDFIPDDPVLVNNVSVVQLCGFNKSQTFRSSSGTARFVILCFFANLVYDSMIKWESSYLRLTVFIRKINRAVATEMAYELTVLMCLVTMTYSSTWIGGWLVLGFLLLLAVFSSREHLLPSYWYGIVVRCAMVFYFLSIHLIGTLGVNNVITHDQDDLPAWIKSDGWLPYFGFSFQRDSLYTTGLTIIALFAVAHNRELLQKRLAELRARRAGADTFSEWLAGQEFQFTKVEELMSLPRKEFEAALPHLNAQAHQQQQGGNNTKNKKRKNRSDTTEEHHHHHHHHHHSRNEDDDEKAMEKFSAQNYKFSEQQTFDFFRRDNLAETMKLQVDHNNNNNNNNMGVEQLSAKDAEMLLSSGSAPGFPQQQQPRGERRRRHRRHRGQRQREDDDDDDDDDDGDGQLIQIPDTMGTMAGGAGQQQQHAQQFFSQHRQQQQQQHDKKKKDTAKAAGGEVASKNQFGELLEAIKTRIIHLADMGSYMLTFTMGRMAFCGFISLLFALSGLSFLHLFFVIFSGLIIIFNDNINVIGHRYWTWILLLLFLVLPVDTLVANLPPVSSWVTSNSRFSRVIGLENNGPRQFGAFMLLVLFAAVLEKRFLNSFARVDFLRDAYAAQFRRRRRHERLQADMKERLRADLRRINRLERQAERMLARIRSSAQGGGGLAVVAGGLDADVSDEDEQQQQHPVGNFVLFGTTDGQPPPESDIFYAPQEEGGVVAAAAAASASAAAAGTVDGTKAAAAAKAADEALTGGVVNVRRAAKKPRHRYLVQFAPDPPPEDATAKEKLVYQLKLRMDQFSEYAVRTHYRPQETGEMLTHLSRPLRVLRSLALLAEAHTFELCSVCIFINGLLSGTLCDLLINIVWFIIAATVYPRVPIRWVERLMVYVLCIIGIKLFCVIITTMVQDESSSTLKFISVFFVRITRESTLAGSFADVADFVWDFIVFAAFVLRREVTLHNGVYLAVHEDEMLALMQKRKEEEEKKWRQQQQNGGGGGDGDEQQQGKNEVEEDTLSAIEEQVETSYAQRRKAKLERKKQQQQDQSPTSPPGSPFGNMGSADDLARIARGDEDEDDNDNGNNKDDDADGGKKMKKKKKKEDGEGAGEEDEDAEDDDGPGFIKVFWARYYACRKGVGQDTYLLSVCWLFAAFFTFVMGYFSLSGLGTGSLLTSLQSDLLPGTLVVVIAALTVAMIIDRAAYLLVSAPFKMVVHTVFSLISFIGYCAYRSEHPDAPAAGYIFFMFQWAYLWVSAGQVKGGFPRARRHDPFTDYPDSMPRWIAYTVYRAIPFLWEIRTCIDWTFTVTSLSFEEWFKVEDIISMVYNRRVELVYQREHLGEPAPWTEKLVGFLKVLFITAVLLFPLMNFSTFNPNTVPNKVTHLSATVQFAQVSPIYQAATFEPNKAVAAMPQYATYLANLYPQFGAFVLNGQHKTTQLVELSTCSAELWTVSPEGLRGLNATLRNVVHTDQPNTTIPFSLTMTFTREHTSGSAALEIPVQFPHELGVTEAQLMLDALQSNVSDIFVPVKAMYNPFVFNQPTGVVEWKNVALDCTLALRAPEYNPELSTDVRYWCMKCPSIFARGNVPRLAVNSTDRESKCMRTGEAAACTGLNYDLPAERANHTNTSLYVVVVSDDVARSFSFLAGLGIIAIYTTFVLAVGNALRGMFANTAHYAVMTEMAHPLHVQTLLQYIDLARFAKRPDLPTEHKVYLQLIDLLRSPETLLRFTGRHLRLFRSSDNSKRSEAAFTAALPDDGTHVESDAEVDPNEQHANWDEEFTAGAPSIVIDGKNEQLEPLEHQGDPMM